MGEGVWVEESVRSLFDVARSLGSIRFGSIRSRSRELKAWIAAKQSMNDASPCWSLLQVWGTPVVRNTQLVLPAYGFATVGVDGLFNNGKPIYNCVVVMSTKETIPRRILS